MRRSLPLLVLVLSTLSTGARADVGEVVGLAVRQNPTLAVARVDVSIAAARVQEARGLEDFVLEMGGAGQSRRQAVAGPVTQTAFDGLSLFIGLSRPLPTGGRIGLRLAADTLRAIYVVGGAESGTRLHAPSLVLSVTQPLLRGLGPRVALAPRRRAEAMRGAARLRRELVATAVVRDVVLGYWELAAADERLMVVRAALEQAREQLAAVTAHVEAGKRPPSDVAEVEVTLALRQVELLEAEQARTERALDLERLVGGPVAQAAFAIDDAPSVVDSERAVAEAIEHSPALALAQAEAGAAQVDLDVAENAILPQLDVSVAGGPLGAAESPEKAWAQLGSAAGYTVEGRLVLTSPLGNHAARGARETARLQLRRVRLMESVVRARLAAEIGGTVERLRTARARATVLARSIEAARRDLEAERARFAAGRASSFDVLRRQAALTQIELELVRARADRHKAQTALEALTGEILGRHGIQLRG